MRESSLSGNQLLGEGLETITNPDKFREAMMRVCEAAFTAIFQAQDDGKLQWRRSGNNLTDLVAEVTVKNGRDEDIVIPAILFISAGDEGFRTGYLMLGSRRNAPCRNTADLRVQRLYTQVTEKPWSP